MSRPGVRAGGRRLAVRHNEPMARPSRRDERRAQILDAARRVAVREGAAGTTLRAVAAEAGMESTAVLYYFAGLGEITRELVFAATDRFITAIRASVAAESTPRARLHAAIGAGVTGGLEGNDSRILYEFWPAGLRDETMNDADHALDRLQVGVYREIIDAGVAAGEFHPRIGTDHLGWALVALEDGLVMDILAGTKTPDEVVGIIRSVAEALLGVDDGATPA
jgi:AcrR family transcriptional regulator